MAHTKTHTAARHTDAPYPPIGTIVAWPSATIPSGWVKCDGTSYLRSGETSPGSMDALFAVISVGYGAVDGTHFTVPNLVGRIPAGKGSTPYDVLGTTGGSLDHTHSPVILVDTGHTHGSGALTIDSHTQKASSQGSSAGNVLTNPVSHTLSGSSATSSHDHTASTGTANAPFLVVNFIIKYA